MIHFYDIYFIFFLGNLNSKKSADKKSKNKNLPAGVNDRDVDLFTISQETAKNFLMKENSKIGGGTSSTGQTAGSASAEAGTSAGQSAAGTTEMTLKVYKWAQNQICPRNKRLKIEIMLNFVWCSFLKVGF